MVFARQCSGYQNEVVTSTPLLSWRAVGTHESGSLCFTASCLARLVAGFHLGNLARRIFAVRTRAKDNPRRGWTIIKGEDEMKARKALVVTVLFMLVLLLTVGSTWAMGWLRPMTRCSLRD